MERYTIDLGGPVNNNDGDVTIRESGVVNGNVTVIDEDLKMDRGAVVKGKGR